MLYKKNKKYFEIGKLMMEALRESREDVKYEKYEEMVCEILHECNKAGEKIDIDGLGNLSAYDLIAILALNNIDASFKYRGKKG